MIKIDENKLIEYQKRFVEGEQYITINGYYEIVSIEKDYYWQSRKVFNHIKLLVQKALRKGLSENLIYGSNGLVALLIPFQKAYNEIKNKELEYIDKVTYGIICVEEGSVDTDELIEDGIYGGKIITYRQSSSCPNFVEFKMDTSSYISSADNYLNEMYKLTDDYISELSMQLKE